MAPKNLTNHPTPSKKCTTLILPRKVRVKPLTLVTKSEFKAIQNGIDLVSSLKNDTLSPPRKQTGDPVCPGAPQRSKRTCTPYTCVCPTGPRECQLYPSEDDDLLLLSKHMSQHAGQHNNCYLFEDGYDTDYETSDRWEMVIHPQPRMPLGWCSYKKCTMCVLNT